MTTETSAQEIIATAIALQPAIREYADDIERSQG